MVNNAIPILLFIVASICYLCLNNVDLKGGKKEQQELENQKAINPVIINEINGCKTYKQFVNDGYIYFNDCGYPIGFKE